MSDSSQQSAATAALSRAPHKSSGSLGPVAQTPSAWEVNDFLRVFCAALLALGAQTARVDRNAVRIAGAFGFAVRRAALGEAGYLAALESRPAMARARHRGQSRSIRGTRPTAD